MIELRRYSAADQQVWDDFVTLSKNGTFLFHRGFMDYHADRFIDHSLIILSDGRPSALLPASEAENNTIVSHGGLTYGGLITDRRMTASLALELFQRILGYYQGEGFRQLLYKPVPHMYHRQPAEEDLHALFLCGARLSRSDLSSTIRLEHFDGFAKSKRAGVKAAQKAGVTVSESLDFALFYAMLADRLSERHGATPTHNQQELELLAGRFPEQIRLFAAIKDSVPCGGILVFDCGTTVHAQYIASTETGREFGALDAIVSHLVTEIYQDRAWFDFGISTLNQGRELNLGLSRQKEMYGARTTVYQQYLVDL